MEWMKRALLRKFIASLPWRRLYSHWMLLQVALHQHRDSVILCRSYKSLQVSIKVLVSGPNAQRKRTSYPYAIDKVSYVNDNFTKTVSDANERPSAKEAIATNGPEGTVFNKTQVSLKPLVEGMHCVCNSIASINNDNLEDTELCTLLTTVVEIIHAASLLSMRPSPHCSIPKTLE